MKNASLLGLCGSLRKSSTNRLLLNEAALQFGDADYQEGNIRFPLFDDDIQQGPGIPAEVIALADQIRSADAVLIATPEYNQGISGALKNALDWLSRVEKTLWYDKPVVLLSAAAGGSGGARAQAMLRLCMSPFRPHILNGPEMLLGQTHNQWDETGRLTNDRGLAILREQMEKLRLVIEGNQA